MSQTINQRGVEHTAEFLSFLIYGVGTYNEVMADGRATLWEKVFKLLPVGKQATGQLANVTMIDDELLKDDVTREEVVQLVKAIQDAERTYDVLPDGKVEELIPIFIEALADNKRHYMKIKDILSS